MFMEGISRRPDKATAYKTLRTHLTICGAYVAILRITPYVLQLLLQEKEELKLEL